MLLLISATRYFKHSATENKCIFQLETKKNHRLWKLYWIHLCIQKYTLPWYLESKNTCDNQETWPWWSETPRIWGKQCTKIENRITHAFRRILYQFFRMLWRFGKYLYQKKFLGKTGENTEIKIHSTSGIASMAHYSGQASWVWIPPRGTFFPKKSVSSAITVQLSYISKMLLSGRVINDISDNLLGSREEITEWIFRAKRGKRSWFQLLLHSKI